MNVLSQYKVPRDEENPAFVKSFSVEEEEQYKAFFDKFGFVVIRNVFTPDECTATVNDIWDYVEQKKYLSRKIAPNEQLVFRDDPTTYEAAPNNQEGILGYNSIFTERAILNRQNANLHKIHSVLYGTPDLLVNHDRYGFFTPTVDIPLAKKDDQSSVELLQLPQRKTLTNLHLDMNPWNYVNDEDDSHAHKVLDALRYKRHVDFIIENNEVGCIKPQYRQLHIQCLLNLLDNYEEDGGFQIVPGFHNHITEWTILNKQMRSWYQNHQTFIMLREENDLAKYAIRVTARAGSVIMWNQTVAHGSRCNNSNKFRMAQFFKVFVKPSDAASQQRLDARRQVVKQQLKLAGIKQEQITSVGKQVFDLKSEEEDL